MINTLNVPSIPKFRLGRVLGFSAALLLTSATASFAAAIPKLNATDTLIEAQLQNNHPGVTLKVAKTTPVNQQYIAEAVIDVINGLSLTGKTLPSTIVTAGLKRVPQYAADISKAALAKVYAATTFSSLSTTAKKNSEATKIVTAAFSKGLATYATSKSGVIKLPNQDPAHPFTGFSNKSDIATQITIQELSALGNPATLAISQDAKVPSPLQVVVIAAVKAAIKIKGTDLEHNGISGAVAGAIYETAGSNNASLKDTTGNDAVVKAVLKAAAKTAQTHALEIAQAAGYAFATTYRQTNGDHATEVGLAQFLTDNVTDIVSAIQAGLSAGSVKKFNLASKVKGQNFGQTLDSSVRIGITKAYATTDSAGGSGRNGVTFANGSATPVTPVF